MPSPLPLKSGYELDRDSVFPYQCQACGRCCQGKLIPLSPYEIAAIAEYLGVSTTQVLERYTSHGGGTLACNEVTDACVFFDRGCTVHPARPLACRLYPLGRHLKADGRELFGEVIPHPQCEARREGNGTVADWLGSQGAQPFLEASDRYVALLKRMLCALANRADLDEVQERATEAMGRGPRAEDGSLLDVDAVVRSWCEAHGMEIPTALQERIDLHIQALEESIEGDAE